MSETPVPQTKAAPATTAISDLRMMAQVEKWMATIREITGEWREESLTATERLERLLAPAAE